MLTRISSTDSSPRAKEDVPQLKLLKEADDGLVDSSSSSPEPDEKIGEACVSTSEISKIPHSMLRYSQKWMMVALLTSAGFWSSLGSPAVYPALRNLQREFGVSEDLVNIAVVVYLLFQGVAPTVCSGLADTYGRRPVILMGMLIFIVSSIGIACSNSFALVIALRCIQSSGISPIIAINSGVVGDFTLKSERGTFIGAVSGLTLLGQAFGSLIGASLTAAYNWRAVFWFMTIGCGVCFLANFLFLPETHRCIVGNLSLKPKRNINFSPVLLLPVIRRQFSLQHPHYSSLDDTVAGLDIVAALKIIACPEILLTLLPAGLQFSLWTLSLTSLSQALQSDPYNYPLTTVGLCYLPSGICGLLGSFLTGKLIDIWYRYFADRFQRRSANSSGPSAPFNVLEARIVAGLPQNFISVMAFIIFGWSIQGGWHISVPLVASGVGTFCVMSTLSTSSTLLIDLYPNRASTASSCYNFIRCTLSALFLAVFARMKASMTIGGTFTFLCSLIFVGNCALIFPMKYGMTWRDRRLRRAAEASCN
ncbi:ADL258Wp [Eremothecium gossypii ATCC 10895]|uniref:ADL258Wp n=1 Tax=Eremothecium gossypii (strain ATCC 10895 / CBS 109.51 / FGSC 9923 / NRRL Y-1056) TaxID=284811 RepID=Q75B35_EREGS|nr:ADL258Wp [Eremothecium gossypii ATCC 10895]AAS51662.1 ADL258Wp [Eremothecium gossypii ATCC 10895]